jgi:DnaJ-class molecular chaperone
MVSYYQVLGVGENDSLDEIKQAYRERMKAHHSDRHGQSDDPIVRLIIEAYRVLSNPTDREEYNKELHRNGTSLSAHIKPRPTSTTTAQSRPREICNQCDGRGYNPILGVGWPCQYCDGQGWVPGKIAV